MQTFLYLFFWIFEFLFGQLIGGAVEAILA